MSGAKIDSTENLLKRVGYSSKICTVKKEVIASRIQIAKELGATERDLAPLLNELVYRPLSALDANQDKNLIEQAEIPRLPRHHEGENDAT